MFERFTGGARRVLVLAQEEARLLNHAFVGTEHLLLGLLREGEEVHRPEPRAVRRLPRRRAGAEGPVTTVLGSFGISIDAVREQVGEIVGIPAEQPESGPVPFTPRAKRVLELSLREALQLGHDHIGTEHLLLGIVREGEGVAAQVLVRLGADLGQVRRRLIAHVSGEPDPGPGAWRDAPTAGGRALRRGPIGGQPAPGPRCALCGRSLWETAHVVVGASGQACEDCIRAGAGLLERPKPGHRELVLPPRVSGLAPDDHAVGDIAAAAQSAFGPGARPSRWATTIEDPERFSPLLLELGTRWGRPEAVRVAEVGFVTEQLAFIHFHVDFDGSRSASVSGQLRRHDDRWLITAETLTDLLRRRGVDVSPPAGAD